MPETNIAWCGTSLGSLTLDAAQLRSDGAAVYPQFMIPLRLVTAPIAVADGPATLRLWTASCELIFNNRILADHQGVVLDLQCYANQGGQEVLLRFPLDLARLEHLERHRQDDLRLGLRGKLVFEASREEVQPNTRQRSQPVLVGRVARYVCSFQLDFVVPRSQWASVLLPGLGWSAVRIIELPVPTAPVWAETFATALAELDEAKRLFSEGNYDQCVAHCRTALEPFRKKAQDLKEPLKEARSGSDIASREFALLRGIANDTADWLSKLRELQHTLASAAHHVPAVGHFNREQAHALLLLTMSLVLYSGDALGGQASP